MPATVPKKKRARESSIHWFERGEADLNNVEKLLCCFLVVSKGFDKVSEMKAWAQRARRDLPRAEEIKSQWKPPESGELGWGVTGKISNIFLPLKRVFDEVQWESAELDAIGIAIQSWNGDEQFDHLRASHLRDYVKTQPIGIRKSKKESVKQAAPRWRTWSVVTIADLIHRRGDDMRRLLQLDEEPEFILTSAERIEMLEKRNAQLERQLKDAQIGVARAQDGQRKAAKRLKVDRQQQRTDDRAKLAERLAEAQKRADEKVRAAKDAAQQAQQDAEEAALKAAEEHVAGRVQQLETQVSTARKRARTVEGRASDAQRNLERAQGVEHELKAAQAKIDEWSDLARQAKAAKTTYVRWQERIESMPTWQRVRGKGAGKGAKQLHPEHTACIWEQFANGTPLAAAGRNVVSVVRRAAPWLNPVEPSIEALRESRFAYGIAEMAMSARRVAAAFRVRQLGFDETTKFGDASMVTSVLLQPTEGAPPEVVILRAAYATGGSTAELLAKAVEDKCFSRLRGFLRGWQAECEQRFPDHKWSGPDPERCGLQRLGGGGGIISDTCTTARCTQDKLIGMVAQQVKQKYDPAVWLQLTAEQQEAAVRCHAQHCGNHIRNIVLAAMSKAQNDLVREDLKDELDNFWSHERVTLDFDQLLRQDYKEFHQGCRYYKGQGKPYGEWLVDTYPTAFVMHFERAEGGRQDLDYDAAVPMYINRKYEIEFLNARIYSGDHQNILEDAIYVTRTKLECVAEMRANAIIDLRITRPWRWLCGKGADLVDWSPLSQGLVLEMIEELSERIARDGSVLLDLRLDIWKDFRRKEPKFQEYFDHLEVEKRMAPDGKTPHAWYKLALQEALDPTDATNVCTRDLTIRYLQAQFAAGIRKLHDPRTVIPKYLSSQDGELSFSKQAQAHADGRGCEGTNDKFAESVFGTFDRCLRRNEGCSRAAAAALAHGMRMKSMWQGDAVQHRKQQEPPPPGWGYHHSLPWQEQHALVFYSSRIVREQRRIDRADDAEDAAYAKAKVKSSSEQQLQNLISEFGYVLSFFDRWKERGVQTVAQMRAQLKKLDPPADPTVQQRRKATQAKLDWLREQIDMRTRGLQWVEFKTAWSSGADEEIGTVEDLTGHLKEILAEEAEQRAAGELPKEAPAPIFKRKTFKELGTPTPQAVELAQLHTELSPEQLREAAERERERLEERGEISREEDLQGDDAPSFTSLIDVDVDIRWRYWVKDPSRKSGRRSQYIWCTGRVVEVADGVKRKSPKCKSPLPWGAVRIMWPEDADYAEGETYVWSVLKPADFNREVHLGWRYAASELQKRQQAAGKRARREE